MTNDERDRAETTPSERERPQAPSQKPPQEEGPDIPEKLDEDSEQTPAVRREADEDLDLNEEEAPRHQHIKVPKVHPDSPDRPRNTGLAPRDPQYQG